MSLSSQNIKKNIKKIREKKSKSEDFIKIMNKHCKNYEQTLPPSIEASVKNFELQRCCFSIEISVLSYARFNLLY